MSMLNRAALKLKVLALKPLFLAKKGKMKARFAEFVSQRDTSSLKRLREEVTAYDPDDGLVNEIDSAITTIAKRKAPELPPYQVSASRDYTVRYQNGKAGSSDPAQI